MSTAQADRIWRSFSRMETTPEDLAERYAARLMECGLDDSPLAPIGLETKHRSIAAALSLIAHNADMLDSIRGVLSRSRVPVIAPMPDRSCLRRARDLLFETLEDAAEQPFDDRLAQDWREVCDVVASAMFGPEAATTTRVAA